MNPTRLTSTIYYTYITYVLFPYRVLYYFSQDQLQSSKTNSHPRLRSKISVKDPRPKTGVKTDQITFLVPLFLFYFLFSQSYIESVGRRPTLSRLNIHTHTFGSVLQEEKFLQTQIFFIPTACRKKYLGCENLFSSRLTRANSSSRILLPRTEAEIGVPRWINWRNTHFLFSMLQHE